MHFVFTREDQTMLWNIRACGSLSLGKSAHEHRDGRVWSLWEQSQSWTGVWEYSLYISWTQCSISVLFLFLERCLEDLESVPEGFGTIIYPAGHSPWTTHPKGGHTEHLWVKGSKRKINKWTTFSCSHFFILSCVRNSFVTSSYTKKNIHEKQKAPNSPQGKTTLYLQLAFYGLCRKNISFSRMLY